MTQVICDDLPDFDTMVRLAKEEPEILEELCERLSQDIIQSAKTERSRVKLEGIHSQIKAARQDAAHPTISCVKIFGMMHDSFCQLSTKIHECREELAISSAIWSGDSITTSFMQEQLKK